MEKKQSTFARCQVLPVMTMLAAVFLASPAAGQTYSGPGTTFPGCGTPSCHDVQGRSQYPQWFATPHASVYDRKPDIQERRECLVCHTTGWNTDVENGGFDDFFPPRTPEDSAGIKRTKNVTCEECHGPTEFPDFHPPSINFDSGICTCHGRDPQPTLQDWEASMHALAKNTTQPGFEWISSDPVCSGCHTAEGFLEFVSEAGYLPDVAHPPGQQGSDIECAACHDPHSSLYESQLRLPKVELCSRCHQPGYDPAAPPVGTAVRHTTGFMFEGIGGFEYVGYAYPNSAHTGTVDDKCVACHFDLRKETGTTPPYTGHMFTPQGVKCLLCHHDFDTTAHSFDYRGIQSEIAGLTATLEGKLGSATHEDSLTTGFLRAQFNRDFVVGDLSGGIHNTDYARALLVSSIAEFNPDASLSATISTAHPPIVIPPQGGSFTYIMNFINNTASTQTVDIWTKLQKPDGSLTIVFGPKRKSFPAQSTRTKSRSLAIPGSYAPGEYHLVLYIGTFESIILSTDTLDFTKSITPPVAGEDEPRAGFVLYQNYPNPFNPTTEIRFALGDWQSVRLTVYNLVGQEVTTLINETLGPGEYSATWDASGVASGLYFYRLNAGPFTDVRKFVVAK